MGDIDFSRMENFKTCDLQKWSKRGNSTVPPICPKCDNTWAEEEDSYQERRLRLNAENRRYDSLTQSQKDVLYDLTSEEAIEFYILINKSLPWDREILG